jgi:NADH-quinone oxidoreductase subunit M
MPVYTALTLLTFLAAMGLPGFSGFIGELMILLGAFSAASQGDFSIWIAALSAFGIFITAAYFIWTMQRMFFGPFMLKELEWKNQITDLKPYEKYSLITLAVLSLLIGLYPTILTGILEVNLDSMLGLMNKFL